MTTGSYDFWQAQLAGKNPEWLNIKEPCAGFFRARYYTKDGAPAGKRIVAYEAVAFWHDGEAWQCLRSKFGDGSDMALDQMAELFASCCRHAVIHEDYSAFLQTGAWPEDVETVEDDPETAPQPDAPQEAKAEEKPADERAKAALAKLETECKDWLKSLGHLPETQAEADKAANYADAFAKIENGCEKAREAEKKPFWDAGKAVDAKWKSIKETAGKYKTWAKNLNLPYIKSEDEKRALATAEENARQQAEYEAQKAIAAKEKADADHLALYGIDSAPVSEVEKPQEVKAEPVKVGTGARRMSAVKQDVYTITNAKLLLHWLAERNQHTQALLDAALAEGRDQMKEGTEVPGIEKTEQDQVR